MANRKNSLMGGTTLTIHFGLITKFTRDREHRGKEGQRQRANDHKKERKLKS